MLKFNYPLMGHNMPAPEAFSRALIDKELEYSGWDLLDSHQVRFESHTRDRRADYSLMDKNGGVLCMLETKRENLDPYDAKEQARGVQSAQGKSAERIEVLYQSMLSRAFEREL